MTRCRQQPCETCPYRKDVPSGIWAKEEYWKLDKYDRPTGEQPMVPFYCHTSPDFLCHGWAVCHEARPGCELLALRLLRLSEDIEIPPAAVPLFGSGRAAARHGLGEYDKPSAKARRAIRKLLAKRARKAGKR